MVEEWIIYLLGAAGLATGVYYYKKSQALGKITIDSTPSGAEIFLDDVDMKIVTPWAAEFHPKDYNVTLKLSGYQDFTIKVNLNSGSTSNINAALIYL